MKNMIKRTMNVTSMAIMLLAAAVMSPAFGQGGPARASNQGNDRIVDAWLTTVTPRNCETGEPVMPPFNSMVTHHQGGTISEYGANPNTPFRSPGHGYWHRAPGRNNYFMAFTFFPLTPAGQPVGRIRVEQYVNLNGSDEEMESYGTFELRNFAGDLLASGCSTATGRRFN